MLLADIVNYRLLIYGCIALGVMLLFSDGLVGTAEKFFDKRARTHNRTVDFRMDRIVPDAEAQVPAADAPVVVEVRDGRKTFGLVAALDGVDFEVRRGEIHGLIGANGSGKTSLLNVLSGFSRLNAGTMRIGGVDTAGRSADRIARLGLGRTFQTPRIFDTLSTWENLQIGLDNRIGTVDSTPHAAVEELRKDLDDLPVELVPHGQRRIMEVLRVVLRGADIILLDEPAAGLSVRERDEFARLLSNICADGKKTIILVEHDLDLVLGIADRITVLETGKVVATGTPAEITGNPAIKALFIGGEDA
jgi:branched-chain amino acid transport system permease protein